MKKYNIAILGATGAVGQTMIQVLEERNFPVNDIKFLASPASVGKKIRFKDQEIPIEEVTPDAFKNIDFVFGAVKNDLAKKYAPDIIKSNAVFIDNSSAFRLEHDVPLIIPEINPEDCRFHHGIIANPNCATIIALIACFPIHQINPIKKMTVTTFQAVSGAGNHGMNELEKQIIDLYHNRETTSIVFPYQIAYNLIPQIGEIKENGYTAEEEKLLYESRKILHCPSLEVNCTCVRVPVKRCHSESITLTCTHNIDILRTKEQLKIAEGVKLEEPYPTPLLCSNQDLVLVGRIRKDQFNENVLDLWCCGDQIRKGAATNAIQIAESLIKMEINNRKK